MYCFVVCPLGDPDSPTRKRSNGFFREVIRPVAKSFDYDVERADHDMAPGVVTEAIVEKLVSADLVVADLHDHNPNVMYEVAIRHATGRPIVQMIPHGEKLPFDIGGLNTIFYDPSIDGLARWREDLRAAIGAVQEGKGRADNPVAKASLFKALRESSVDQDQVLSTLVDSVDQLRAEIRVGRRSPRRSERPSRILLPPDKYVESEVARFLNGDPSLSEFRFMLDARDKNLRVSVYPEDLGEVFATLEYDIDWDDDGIIPISEMTTHIRRDILEAARAQEMPTLFEAAEEAGEDEEGQAS